MHVNLAKHPNIAEFILNPTQLILILHVDWRNFSLENTVLEF